MRWFTIVERGIDVPPLKLCVASCKRFSRWWVSVVIIASPTGSESFDAIMIISLITFANEPYIRGYGYPEDSPFLKYVSDTTIETD